MNYAPKLFKHLTYELLQKPQYEIQIFILANSPGFFLGFLLSRPFAIKSSEGDLMSDFVPGRLAGPPRPSRIYVGEVPPPSPPFCRLPASPKCWGSHTRYWPTSTKIHSNKILRKIQSWALVSEPGFGDFQNSRLLLFVFLCEVILKNWWWYIEE